MRKVINALHFSLALLTTFFLTAGSSFAERTPSESEVLTGALQSLGNGTKVIEVEYESFPVSDSDGRVNVVGTYSFDHDFFSYPQRAAQLYDELSRQHGISDQQVLDYIKENFGQNVWEIKEVRKVYSAGTPLRFDGDLRYKSVVGGVEVTPGSLRREVPDGSPKLLQYYVIANSLQQEDLKNAIVDWVRRNGRFVDLSKTVSNDEQILVGGIAHDEFVTVQLPYKSGRSGCWVNWGITDAWKNVHGEKEWLGWPEPQILEKVSGGSGLVRKYAVLKEVETGMTRDGILLDMWFSAVCK